MVDEKEYEDLKDYVTELATVVWGDDRKRDNGVRGDLRALEETVRENTESIDKLREWGQDIWNVQRPLNCIGRAAVKDLEEKIKKAEADEQTRRDREERLMVEIRKSRNAMIAALGGSVITATGAVLAVVLG